MRPQYPKCPSRMTLKRISPDPLTGMESRTFECQRCGQSLTEVANSDVDPIAGVASSGLQPPKWRALPPIPEFSTFADALSGAYGVVNAVSLYVERGQETFNPFTSRPPNR